MAKSGDEDSDDGFMDDGKDDEEVEGDESEEEDEESEEEDEEAEESDEDEDSDEADDINDKGDIVKNFELSDSDWKMWIPNKNVRVWIFKALFLEFEWILLQIRFVKTDSKIYIFDLRKLLLCQQKKIMALCMLRNVSVTLGGGGAWKKAAFLRKVRLYCTVEMNLCLWKVQVFPV